MNEKKTDVSEIKTADFEERTFPVEPAVPYRISMTGRSYEAIFKHAEEDKSIEICGVLVGDVYRDAKGPYLEITDAIRGEHATNKSGQVTFTHETWAHINGIKDSEYPDRRIVGWYHSHPEYGVFLSSQDTFIHANFFGQPWQVAFVIDPVSEEEGFFIWRDGRPDPVKEYWRDGRKRSADENESRLRKDIRSRFEELRDALSASDRPKLKPIHLISGFVIISLLILLTFFKNEMNVQNMIKGQSEGQMALAQLLSPPGEEAGLKTAVEQELKKNALLAPLEISVLQKGGQIWLRGEVYTTAQKELLAKIAGSARGVESVDSRGIAVTHRYIVAEGDFLGKIALKIYGNSDRWKDLYEANKDSLKDPFRIPAFITLRVPE